MAAFLFDLDMTLVDSSQLTTLRRTGLWSEVMGNLHRIRPFVTQGKIQPHQLPSILRKQGEKVGIVTSSPKRYAEEVLKNFGIEYDLLVAYHDTTNHKPDPEPLLKAIQDLKEPAKNSLYVGDDPVDVEASYHAGCLSIGAGWGVVNWAELASSAPQILIHKPDHLLAFSEWPLRKYVGDCNEPAKCKWHEGSVIWIDEPGGSFALGRYHSTDDPRHAQSGLSKKILQLKSADTPVDFLTEALTRSIKKIALVDEYPYLVCVPPKLNAQRNRYEEILKNVKKELPHLACYPDGLATIKDYGNLKAMGPIERRVAVKGAIKSKYTWRKSKVLLLDDVLTTGSTSDECRRVLLSNDASDVKLIVFGKDQRTFSTKTCPKCQRKMRIRANRKDNSKFWGCSGYPEHCKYTENI